MTEESLDEWLLEMRRVEAAPDWRGENEFDEDDDHDEGAGAGDGDSSKRLVWRFPSDSALSEFLASINSRSEEEIDLVLRNLLMRPAALGVDHMRFEMYLGLMRAEDDASQQRAAAMTRDPHFRRTLDYYAGRRSDLPWEGMQWVRQLLPQSPATALAAIDAYFVAHMSVMTDSIMFALSDAELVIRARYIGIPETQVGRRNLLLDLHPRQFERLVDALYNAMGYETELTPATRDRGRDVIARKLKSGIREHLLIQCKRYNGTIGADPARTLLGVVQIDQATAGKVVTTATFSREARTEFQDIHSIELIDGLELVVLMNEHLGSDWPIRLDSLVSERPTVLDGSARDS